MTIGNRIRELRQERGLSQEALGARSGISTFSVSRIETGRSVPGSDTVEKVARALGVEPGELFQDVTALAGKGRAPQEPGRTIRLKVNDTVGATDKAIPLIDIGEFKELLVEAGLDQETAEWTAERVFAKVEARRDG